MALIKIIKLTVKTWKHNSDVDGDFILTKFYAKTEENDFLLVESYGAKRRKYKINEIEVYDIGGGAETFTNFDDLFLRLETLKYPAFYVDALFEPSNYDLSDFNNASANPFIRESNLVQTYKTIATNTTLDNTFHNATIYVTANSDITIPSGLRSDFNATFRTFTGITATFLTSGTVINTESDGSIMAEKSMCYLSVFSVNNYIISGGGLS